MAYDLTERRAVDAIHSSWLSRNPQASMQGSILIEILSDKVEHSDRQILTTGKFDAEWSVSMSYRIAQGSSEPKFGLIKFPDCGWQYRGWLLSSSDRTLRSNSWPQKRRRGCICRSICIITYIWCDIHERTVLESFKRTFQLNWIFSNQQEWRIPFP